MKLGELRTKLTKEREPDQEPPKPSGEEHTHATPYGPSGAAVWRDDGTHYHATAVGKTDATGAEEGHWHTMPDGRETGPFPPQQEEPESSLCGCPDQRKLKRGEEPAGCATCSKDVGYESGFPY